MVRNSECHENPKAPVATTSSHQSQVQASPHKASTLNSVDATLELQSPQPEFRALNNIPEARATIHKHKPFDTKLSASMSSTPTFKTQSPHHAFRAFSSIPEVRATSPKLTPFNTKRPNSLPLHQPSNLSVRFQVLVSAP